MKTETEKDYCERDYKSLCNYFGVRSSLWTMAHETFSPTMFRANKNSLIGEYLIWEEFVKRAKSLGVIYYYGIDVFLEEYKEAVYSSFK